MPSSISIGINDINTQDCEWSNTPTIKIITNSNTHVKITMSSKDKFFIIIKFKIVNIIYSLQEYFPLLLL